MTRLQQLLFFIVTLGPFIGLTQLNQREKDLLRNELSERVNALRISKGLLPLQLNDTLRSAAEFHSKYMAKKDVLSHHQKSGPYKTPEKRVRKFGGKAFELVGENVLHSLPQKLPLNKKQIKALAEEMFQRWKNSPGHYANMIETEYVFGDFGFEVQTTKQTVYATHVFGKKGMVIHDQLSSNAFGIRKASSDCEKAFQQYSNLVLNMGNSIDISGDEVVLYYHSIDDFKQIISNPNDGIAIDLVSRDQLACGRPNQLDFSPVYDGILLEPMFSAELLNGNRAQSEYRVITKVADIPRHIDGEAYSPSVILLKDGKACKYIYPCTVESRDYTLRPFTPVMTDEPATPWVEKGVRASQRIGYDFDTDQKTPIAKPQVQDSNGSIHSISIHSFSSVEGDSIHNQELHTARAKFIQNHLCATLNVSPEECTIEAKEHWEAMIFQLNYLHHDALAKLSRDSLRSLIALRHREDLPSLSWDSLFFQQRKSEAIVHYADEYSAVQHEQSIGEFNLRTAVVLNDVALANKAMYAMHQRNDYDPQVLFEPSVIAFAKVHPGVVGNYAALLSNVYRNDPYLITALIHSWLPRAVELDLRARSNILHLYTLIGTYLLDHWDVSAERLSNVIHPKKIQAFLSDLKQSELLLNLHLTFIQFYGQINDGPNISKSFYYISEYFKKGALRPEEDVDLTLFFNRWSMYHLTVEHLLPRFKKNTLNEDGVFLLAQTMNFTGDEDQSEDYLEVHKKALETNSSRWCEWLKSDFQVKRNYRIKRMYCKSCNEQTDRSDG